MFSICNSLSDSDILNCNKLFWDKHLEFESRTIWGLGKELGITYQGNEETLINRIQDMSKGMWILWQLMQVKGGMKQVTHEDTYL